MTKFYAWLWALLLLPGLALAQNILTGRVAGTDAPEGLPGAAVMVNGTSRGAATGADGTFSLNLQPGDTAVRVSYLGYTTQVIGLAGRTTLDVTLAPNLNLQDEVVVVGYGVQRRSDVTGAVSSLRGPALTSVPNQNAVQALQGRVTGVQIASPSGEPGANPVVRIRGVGTFSAAGNDPLYVVDGTFMTDISSINPADIESIEVLKDASAAAIFGVRGANGVIVVTTKRGQAGKTTINFSTEVGAQTIPNLIPLLDGRQFAQLTNEIGVTNYNNIDRLPNTDWQRQVFRTTSPVQTHQFSVSGGSNVGTAFFSVGYFRQDGMVPNSYFERFTIRSNNTLNVAKWWTVGNNLTITPNTNRSVPPVYLTAYRADPTIAVRNDTTGRYNEVPTYGNPVADIEYNSYNYRRGLNGVGNVFSEFKLPYGLRYRANFGFDLNFDRGTIYTPIFFVSAAQSNTITRLATSRNTRSNLLVDNLLYWTRSFGKHNLDALVGYSQYRNFSLGLSANGQQLLAGDPSGYYLNTGIVVAGGAQEGAQENRLNSVLGRLNYNYDSRYLFTATIRRDASSLFGAANRSAVFPSVALGWVVSREAFMANVSAISNLKLRASAGRLGNQAVDAGSQNARFNLINAQTPVVFGAGDLVFQGASLNRISNPDIRWETTTSQNLGLEVGLWNNRLVVEADYYRRTTDGILAELPLPLFSGSPVRTVLVNAAKVRNTGIEFAATWRDNIGAVGYRLGVLGTTVRNEVLSMGNVGQSGSFIAAGGLEGSFITRTQVGRSIGDFYGWNFIGVFQNQAEIDGYPSFAGTRPGDAKFEDVNRSGRINDSDRVFMGSPIPKFVFGFNLGASYKGFDLQADFQGQTGNMIYNGKEVIRPGLANFEERWADRWTPDNPTNSLPRATVSGANFLPSQLFLQKGDFLRLRTLTLSYRLPQPLQDRLKAQGISVFVRGTNLFTLTQFTGYSPEIGDSNALSAGIDLGRYPITRVISGGVNVSF